MSIPSKAVKLWHALIIYYMPYAAFAVVATQVPLRDDFLSSFVTAHSGLAFRGGDDAFNSWP